MRQLSWISLAFGTALLCARPASATVPPPLPAPAGIQFHDAGSAPSDGGAGASADCKGDTASGRWLAEDMQLDLRPQLSNAAVPILLIAPFDASVDGRYHLTTPDQKRAFYQSLVAGAPNLQIDMIDHSLRRD